MVKSLAEILQCRERGALSGMTRSGVGAGGASALQCRERGALSGMSDLRQRRP